MNVVTFFFFSDGTPSSYDGLNNRVSWTYGDFKDLEISNKLIKERKHYSASVETGAARTK